MPNRMRFRGDDVYVCVCVQCVPYTCVNYTCPCVFLEIHLWTLTIMMMMAIKLTLGAYVRAIMLSILHESSLSSLQYPCWECASMDYSCFIDEETEA